MLFYAVKNIFLYCKSNPTKIINFFSWRSLLMKSFKCKACDYKTVIKFNFCPQCGFNQSKIYVQLRYLFSIGIISFVVFMFCVDDNNKLENLGATFFLISMLSIFSALFLWLKRLVIRLYGKIMHTNKNILKEQQKPVQDLPPNNYYDVFADLNVRYEFTSKDQTDLEAKNKQEIKDLASIETNSTKISKNEVTSNNQPASPQQNYNLSSKAIEIIISCLGGLGFISFLVAIATDWNISFVVLGLVFFGLVGYIAYQDIHKPGVFNKYLNKYNSREITKKTKLSKYDQYIILTGCLIFVGIACLAFAFFLEKTSLYFWGGGIIFIIFFSAYEEKAIPVFSLFTGIISLVVAYNTDDNSIYYFIGAGFILLASYVFYLLSDDKVNSNNTNNNSLFDISFNTSEEDEVYDDDYYDYKPKRKKRKAKSYVASKPQPTSVEVWTGNKTINFEYNDAEGNFTERKVRLYSIKKRDYDYLLIGYCYLRSQRRDFISSRTTGLIRYKKELYPTGEFIKKCINGEL